MICARFSMRCPRGHETRAEAAEPTECAPRCGWRETPDAREACLRDQCCTRPEPLHDGMRCGEHAVARYDRPGNRVALRCAPHDLLMQDMRKPWPWTRTAIGARP